MRYVYRCPRCGVTTEKSRKVEERHDPVECVECKAPMVLAPAAVAPSFPGAASWRDH